MPNEREVREARVFASYLGAASVPSEISERYHRAIQHWRAAPSERFDAWLVRLAATSQGLTAIADTYARFARPYGDLRCRLTLMLALLETHGATHAAYDRARPSSAAGAWLALAGLGTLWALRALLAVAICAPAHLLLGAKVPARQSA
ncbi:MAG TPA: hypothetical protein VH762_00090 [Gemmatimonadaceae bacterium]|jgi:hypothetical protein